MIDIGCGAKLFNLSEAQQLLPLLQSITQKHYDELMPIQMSLNKMLSNDPRRKVLEKNYEEVVLRWRTKINQLGVVVSALWVVEFDVGEGYLSWRHSELALGRFRLKGAAVTERLKLSTYIDEHDPDWAR